MSVTIRELTDGRSKISVRTPPEVDSCAICAVYGGGGHKMASGCTLDCGTETAVEKIKQNTRIYSRKQMTWFRRDESIHWFHPDETEAIKKLIEKEIMP